MRISSLWPLVIWGPAIAAPVMAADAYPAPRFSDPARIDKLASGYAQVDDIMRTYATAKRIPGMVWGIVIDGKLAHVESMGVAGLSTGAPVNEDTVFRIASMTKSFTALAI